MSGADLFVDGFPHGTPAGYERGCRGGACPAKVETGQSCREANVRASSDYGYRRLVMQGASTEVLAQPEVPLAEAPAPEVKPKARRGADLLTAPLGQHKPKPKPVPMSAPVEPAAVPVAEPAPEEVPSVRAAKPLVHGTSHGYARGCKTDEECPGGADGVTCRQAYRAYHREYARRRRAAGTPTPVPPPAAPAEPVEELPAAMVVDEPEPEPERELEDDVDEDPIASINRLSIDTVAIADALEAFSFAFHQLSKALRRDPREQTHEGESHV